VAHEINNPLNIISGYAELTARKLRTPGPLDAASAAEAAKCLHIIRDEAFRCKDITEKLLSLSKGGNEDREVLSLADVAKEVAEMTRGLKSYRDRRLRLRFPADEPLCVVAQRTEMKQVLLNLTVNALEAVKPREGEVCIEGRRTNGWVELRVKDNGRGIPAETLRHVFEPFFTDKRGASVPGTGLGLSITHAIVENHGGRIRAESGGVGRGSQFTMTLPWAKKSVESAPQSHGDTQKIEETAAS
jgi:signal transduction histidine kinase